MTCGSAPTGRCTSSGGDGASFNNVDYGQFGGSTGSPTPEEPVRRPAGRCRRRPRRRRPRAAARCAARASAARPASRSSSTARSSGSIRRPAPGLPTNPLREQPGRERAADRRLRHSATRSGSRSGRARTSSGSATSAGTTWEEIDRIVEPARLAGRQLRAGRATRATASSRPTTAAGLDLCTSLYATPTGLLSPYFSYSTSAPVVPGETCPTGSSSIAGMAFYQGGTYPASYDGALFFADHSRNCIWAMKPGTNGLPDPTKIETFVAGAANPVDLEIGPNGDLFYVDFEGGTIHRVTYGGSATRRRPPSSARRPTSGPSPLLVAFDGTGSTDPEGRRLTYAWDLDDDGQYDDSTVGRPRRSRSRRRARIRSGLRVTDPRSRPGPRPPTILVDDALPHPVIDTPASVADVEGRRHDRVQRPRHRRPGGGAARQRPVVDAGPSALPVELPHPHDPDVVRASRAGRSRRPTTTIPSYLELILTATDRVPGTSSTSRRPRPADGRPHVPDHPDRPVARRRDVSPRPSRRSSRTVIVELRAGPDRADAADPSAARRTPSRRGPTAARDRTRSSPRPRPRPTPRPIPRSGTHELPVRPRLHRHGQRLGTGREGQEQRRARRPATARRSPSTGWSTPRAWAPTPPRTSATR